MNSDKLFTLKYWMDRKVLLIVFTEFLLLFIKHTTIFNIGILHLINFSIIYILLFNIPLYKINFTLTLIYNFFLLLINDLLTRLFGFDTYDDGTNYNITIWFIFSLIIGSFIMFIYCFIFNRKNILKNISFLIIGFICCSIIYYFINRSILIGNKYGVDW